MHAIREELGDIVEADKDADSIASALRKSIS